MAGRQKLVAVVTGDVVNSTRLRDRALLTTVLKEAFESVHEDMFGMLHSFELFRGDSFQGVMDPSQALRVAIVIRARLRQWEGPVPFTAVRKRPSVGKQHMHLPPSQLPDARISIGVGTTKVLASRVVESDGEAFVRSGHGLDDLVRSINKLSISTPWEEVNAELSVSVKLLDAVVSRWSSGSAQAMFLHLTKQASQSEMSSMLDISQPAIHKRLAAADHMAVQAAIDRYTALIRNHL